MPILRVTAIEPQAVTLNTANVSLRRFAQRPGEVLVLGQVLDTRVRVNDPELEQLAGIDVVVVDLGIEQIRSRDWMVTRVAVRGHRRLGRRGTMHVVDWQNVAGLTPSALAMPGQGVAQLLHQFEGQRPIEVADAIRELPAKRRNEVVNALDDERLADIMQELSEDEQSDLLLQLDTERAADVLEAMDPDDAADLLGVLNPTEAEVLLARMDPEDSDPVRRLLQHSPDTAGGLMTSEPVVLAPDTTVAEALARVRDPDLTPALSSLVFVVRPPTSTPTGRYLGCVHLQRLLREPPATLVSGIVDADLPTLEPDVSLAALTRYFAAYNLVCGPVVDEEGHLLGAVTVDDVLDHLLPHDWRASVGGTRTGPGLMSDSSSRGRLDTPRTSRNFTPRVDVEAVGRVSESFARFLGTGRYLAIQTVFVIVWIALNLFAVGLRWDPYPFILLNLAFSTQAAYAAPLILLAQNRQENRDRVSLDEDRRRAEQTKADTEYLARELAALRLAIGEVATRDYLRRELEELHEKIDALQPERKRVGSGKADAAERRAKKSGGAGGCDQRRPLLPQASQEYVW